MEYIKNSVDLRNKKTLAVIAGALIIFLGIPVTVYVSLHQRELRSRATGLTLAPAPRGIFIPRDYSPENRDDPFNINSGMLNNDLVDGFSIVVQWKNIEPTSGTIATRSARLREDIINKIASPSAKKVVLRFRAGGDATPQFILDNPKIVKLNASTVAPWDMTYLQEWARVVRYLGPIFSGQSWLSRVNMSGPTRTWDEIGPADLKPAEYDTWISKGYTTKKIIDAWNYIVSVYKEAFPKEYLAIAFRPIVPSEQADTNNPKAEFWVVKAIADNAFAQLGGRFVFQNSDFADQNPPLDQKENPYTQIYNYMKAISCQTPTGLQVGEGHMSSDSNAYQNALTRFEPLQLRYLETEYDRVTTYGGTGQIDDTCSTPLCNFRKQLLANPTNLVCNNPPSAPTNLNAVAISPTKVHLVWDSTYINWDPSNPPTDYHGVVGYKIFRDGNQIGTSVIPTFTDEHLTAQTPYYYEVSSYDTQTTDSPRSDRKYITTPPVGPDQASKVIKAFPQGIIRVAGFGLRATLDDTFFDKDHYPWVQGFAVIERWSSLQPKYNCYDDCIDWSYLDNTATQAARVKRPVVFIIHTGGNGDLDNVPAPAWLTGAPLFRPSLSLPNDNWNSMVPWDAVMRNFWLALSSKIAARYDDNPWVAGIYVAGVNARYPEMIFTDSKVWVNNNDPPPAGIKATVGPNNDAFDTPSGSVYSTAWLDSLITMAEQFKKTWLINMIDGVRDPTSASVLYGPMDAVIGKIKDKYLNQAIVTATIGSDTNLDNPKFTKILDFRNSNAAAKVVLELGPDKFTGAAGEVYGALQKCRRDSGCWAAITHEPTWGQDGYPDEMMRAFDDFWKRLGDLDGDGDVDIHDLSTLISNWGPNGGIADLNGDSKVDVYDLSILLKNWGP